MFKEFEEIIVVVEENDCNEKGLTTAFETIECENKRVAYIVTNLKIFQMLRQNMRNCLDVNTVPKLLNLGYRGTLWGADIWIKDDIENLMCLQEDSFKMKKLFPEVLQFQS